MDSRKLYRQDGYRKVLIKREEQVEKLKKHT
jgi:hypothetical protein